MAYGTNAVINAELLAIDGATSAEYVINVAAVGAVGQLHHNALDWHRRRFVAGFVVIKVRA